MKIDKITEVDDDNLSLTFDLDEETYDKALHAGVKLMFYCHALGISTDDAFDMVLRGVEVQDGEET